MFYLGKTLSAKRHDAKLSPLEFLLLLEVHEAGNVGISGYDLMDKLTDFFSGTWAAKSGTIYPVLSRMKGKKLIDSLEIRSKLGPAKKVFKLTPMGGEILEDLLVSNLAPEIKLFGNYLGFCIAVMKEVMNKEGIEAADAMAVRMGLDDLGALLKHYQEELEELGISYERFCPACNTILFTEKEECPACGIRI